jgi:hypothetical protein
MKLFLHRTEEDTHYIRDYCLTCAEDPRIDGLAKWLHLYAFSRPDGWEWNMADVRKRVADGRDAIYKALDSLEKYGYLQRIKCWDKENNRVQYQMNWYENPLPENQEVPAKDGDSLPENQEVPPEALPENPLPENQEALHGKHISTITTHGEVDPLPENQEVPNDEPLEDNPEVVHIMDPRVTELYDHTVKCVTWLNGAKPILLTWQGDFRYYIAKILSVDSDETVKRTINQHFRKLKETGRGFVWPFFRDNYDNDKAQMQGRFNGNPNHNNTRPGTRTAGSGRASKKPKR